MTRLSMDLKVIPISDEGHRFILIGIYAITSYMGTIPIHQPMSEEIDILMEYVFCKCSVLECMIMNQNRYFL